MSTRVKIKTGITGPKVQDYIKSLGLLPMGKVQTFVDVDHARLADPFVPSDTTAIRKSVFHNSTFGSGEIIYSIYGNPNGKNTYEDTTSRFQDAPMRGSFWIHRMLILGGREKIIRGIMKLLNRK